MPRLLLRAAFVAIVCCASVYVADATAWHLRGRPTGSITVSQVTAATLKRNREEYYFDGDITVACARAAFPQLTASGWLPTCWYLDRHRLAVTRP